MISKEKLEELIKQEATIYRPFCGKTNVSWEVYDRQLHKNFYIDKDENDNEQLFCNCNKCIERNGEPEIVGCLGYILEDYYETKEEAEFVAKNHDTRVEKFEPPFELKQYENYEFISQNYDVGVCHIGHLNGYCVCNYDNYVDKFFNTYSEAVDYAHKLFKGEE